MPIELAPLAPHRARAAAREAEAALVVFNQLAAGARGVASAERWSDVAERLRVAARELISIRDSPARVAGLRARARAAELMAFAAAQVWELEPWPVDPRAVGVDCANAGLS